MTRLIPIFGLLVLVLSIAAAPAGANTGLLDQSYDPLTRTITLEGGEAGYDKVNVSPSVDTLGNIEVGTALVEGQYGTLPGTDLIVVRSTVPVRFGLKAVKQFMRDGNEVKIRLEYPVGAGNWVELSGFSRPARVVGRGNWLDLNGDGDLDIEFVPGVVSTLSLATGAGDDFVNLKRFAVRTGSPRGLNTYGLGGGRNVFYGGADRAEVFGGAARDVVYAGSAYTRFWGGAGDDSFVGGAGGSSVWSGAGDDRLVGGPGRDNLRGQSGTNTLMGRGGADTLGGGAGSDIIYGGPGNDFIWDNYGFNRVFAGPGKDRVIVGPDSTVNCGSGAIDGWGKC